MELMEYLPRRDRLAHALGLRPSRSYELMMGFGLFGAGLVVGSALVLMLAPRSREEAREQLRSRMESVRDRLRPAGPDGEDQESANV
jgi:gas vesicle protein